MGYYGYMVKSLGGPNITDFEVLLCCVLFIIYYHKLFKAELHAYDGLGF